MLSKVYNRDCLEAMREMPDKAFELAIVDPPYQNKDAIGLINSSGHKANRTAYKIFENVRPSQEYFDQLKRVSRMQIIWGGNFFGLSGGYVCWCKEGTAFGEAELAYHSGINSIRIFNYRWNGMLQENMANKERRIHPTQKPVALYKWLLQNYAKPSDRILDSHMGSQSLRIACWDLGFDFEGYEIDEDYYKSGCERFERHKAQGTLFTPTPEPPITQEGLFSE